MRRRASSIAAVLLFVLSGNAWAADVRVASGSDDLSSVVERAASGDRIILEPGVYKGPVVIEKPLSLEGSAGTVLDGGGVSSVIKIQAPDVAVRGLTIINSGTNPKNLDGGIYIAKGADRPVIENNTLTGNLFGIVLHGCKNATVRDNLVANRNDLWLNDRGNGIHIWNNTGSTIAANTIKGGRDGIYVEISHDNFIRANRMENLRFAVHYMYANRNEVSDNISLKNHVGYAIMYSDRVEARHNLSIGDLQHGLMLHTTHHSEVTGNYVYGTGEKCLFIYTSAVNDIHDNRLENCGVGVHFTGGSERNTFHGNSFVNNETQVKYTGLRLYEWSKDGRGNYWSDNPAFDLDGDGLADNAYRPNTFVDWVLWRYPLAKLLVSSPALEMLRYVQSQFPTFYPGGAIDSHPLMRASPAPVEVPNDVELTAAPRDPAQAGSNPRPTM